MTSLTLGLNTYLKQMEFLVNHNSRTESTKYDGISIKDLNPEYEVSFMNI